MRTGGWSLGYPTQSFVQNWVEGLKWLLIRHASSRWVDRSDVTEHAGPKEAGGRRGNRYQFSTEVLRSISNVQAVGGWL